MHLFYKRVVAGTFPVRNFSPLQESLQNGNVFLNRWISGPGNSAGGLTRSRSDLVLHPAIFLLSPGDHSVSN